MARVLAVSDEVDPGLSARDALGRRADVIVSCGDLPFEYLEHLTVAVGAPLVYVLGNHDPDLRDSTPPTLRAIPETPGPRGCIDLDGRILDVAGLRLAGLGGSLRYSGGPHQYTQRQMRRRAVMLEARATLKARRHRRRLDILVTHAPPRHCGDEDDLAHRGFDAFHRLLARLSPGVMVHGHVHPYGRRKEDRKLGNTHVVNAVGYRLLEVPL